MYLSACIEWLFQAGARRHCRTRRCGEGRQARRWRRVPPLAQQADRPDCGRGQAHGHARHEHRRRSTLSPGESRCDQRDRALGHREYSRCKGRRRAGDGRGVRPADTRCRRVATQAAMVTNLGGRGADRRGSRHHTARGTAQHPGRTSRNVSRLHSARTGHHRCSRSQGRKAALRRVPLGDDGRAGRRRARRAHPSRGPCPGRGFARPRRAWLRDDRLTHVMSTLRRVGYDGAIGLEYKPISPTLASLERARSHLGV